MSIVQISQLQVRRGLNEDLPQLSSGELGWSIDTRQLYIGNGTIAEGAPVEGQTEILTQFSVLNFTNSFTANVVALQSNIAIIQGNIVTMQAEIAVLQAGTLTSNTAALSSTTNTPIASITANNATVSYNLNENGNQRVGTIRLERVAGTATVGYDEEYSQTGTTLTTFSVTANTAYSTIWANTSSNPASLTYRISSL
jgi:hypothetical protein